ncbi:MAG: branched-chain amino acid ABC transporter permease [Pseudomonadota bacterium]
MDFILYILLPQILHGLVLGVMIALISLGLTVVFGLMDVVNFAHGEFYMLGAFAGYFSLSLFPNFWMAALVGGIAVAIFGIIIEMVMLRPLYKSEPIFQLLLTFGLGLILRELVRVSVGGETQRVEVPISQTIEFLGMVYPVYRLVIIGIGAVLLGVIWLLLNRTTAGAILRAASQDRQMSIALGINVVGVYTITFALGVGLAGLAGVLMSPIYYVYPTMGVDIILRCFIVVIMGGMGSVAGAIIAALIIGQVESLASLVISPTWAETLIFVVLIATMILKPHGIGGKT